MSKEQTFITGTSLQCIIVWEMMVFVDNNIGRDRAMQTFLAPVARMGVILLPRCFN